jgi:DNA (cytosine-5)-methyltransferase 1
VLFPDELTMYEEFAGGGGTSFGASEVPGISMIAFANHLAAACEAHRNQARFRDTEHFQEDLTKLPAEKMPYATIFGGSPVCPPFSNASGIVRDFDKKNAQLPLFPSLTPEDPKIAARREKYRRGRMLMQEPIKYLRAMKRKYGRPVLGGVIENVPQARQWAEWDRWIGEFHSEDYYTKVIAYNSMHAVAPKSRRAPQSRDRLYVMFWHKSLGRHPDFDKWLRPAAYCPTCATTVNAMQVFKKPGADMGRYRAQYTYRCPNVTCRHQEVFPNTVPALSAIDPNIPGIRLGDRAALGMPALVEGTMERIVAGIRKYWAPLLVPIGGTWREHAQPLSREFPTRTTKECDAVVVHPAFSLPPFITPMRGGGDKGRARSIFDPAHTVTAGGNHHGYVTPPLVMRNYTARPGQEASMTTPATEPLRAVTASGNQSLLTWQKALLVPYHKNDRSAVPVGQPMGTLTTKDRYGLLTADDMQTWAGEFDLDDVMFRMLTPDEVRIAMAFPDEYDMPAHFSREIQMMLYGNACTPPVMELLYSCLAECITGIDYDRGDFALAA